MKNLLYILLLLLSLQACKKDKGNYDYTEVNKLTVLDADGTTITNKTYYLTYGNELNIIPKVSSSLNGTATSLKYTWIVAGDTTSTAAELKMKSEDIGTGSKFGKLIVTDGATQASYSYNFTIVVSASISKGTFLLTEDEQHDAIVTMRATGVNTPYLSFKEFNGYKLGKYPIAITLGYKSTSSTNRNFLSMVTLVKESDYPVMVTDIGTLYPTMLYKKDAMIDNGVFNPTYLNISSANVSTNKLDGYVVVDGKARVLAKGVIGEDMYKTDAFNYNAGEFGITPSTTLAGYFMGVYDQKNERIRLFGNNVTSARFNIFNRDYDDLINKDATKGHTYITAADIRPTNNDWMFQTLTRKNNDLYKHDLVMRLTTPYQPVGFTSSAPKTIPNLDKAVAFRYHVGLNFWYFALGRTIYRFSYMGLDVQPYITLPEDGSGDIVTWNFEMQGAGSYTKIGIATYNATTAKALKGSYYIYDIGSNTFDVKDTFVINKAVDLKIGI